MKGSRISRHPTSQWRVFLLERRSLPVYLVKKREEFEGPRGENDLALALAVRESMFPR